MSQAVCHPLLPAAITRLSYSLLTSSLEASRSGDAGVGIFLSPLSVYYALTLALNGAGSGSETHQEVLKLLTADGRTADKAAEGTSLAESDLNAELSKLTGLLTGTDSTAAAAAGEQCTLLLANGVFTKSTIKPEYTQAVAKLFNATSQQITDVTPVNTWVKEQTKGEIPELLQQGMNFDTVLANALYFKGLWHNPFKPSSTTARVFHAPTGDRRVMMMSGAFDKGNKVNVVSVPGTYDAVLLPYKGGQYAAMAVLPAPGMSVQDAIKAMGDDSVQKQSSMPGKTIVVMPKFRSESGSDLSSTLKGLGMQAAFSPSADFSRISQGLYVSAVMHKAVVDVDESGTVAAAATAVMMTRSLPMPDPEPVELVFDRPFVFGIMHGVTGVPVFMGVVQAPPQAPDDAPSGP